jgi:hypothetical protein
MAALTTDRKFKELASGLSRKVAYKPGNHQFFAGGMVMLGRDDGSAGPLIKPASGSSGGVKAVVVGIANDHSDGVISSTNPYVFQRMEVLEGVFGFSTGTGVNAISGSMIGQLVYASDDQTVNATSNTQQWPIAGRLSDFDSTTSTAYVLMKADLIPSGATF